MLSKTLAELFERDLLKLKEEILLYKDENKMWLTENQISNSGGNLCLHLIGNLNHFIGATLGNSGYIRQRDLEFSSKDVPRATLIEKIDATIQVIVPVLNQLTQEQLEADFPLEKHGKIVTTEYMLLHLLTHLSYHLGQINYHRRLLDV